MASYSSRGVRRNVPSKRTSGDMESDDEDDNHMSKKSASQVSGDDVLRASLREKDARLRQLESELEEVREIVLFKTKTINDLRDSEKSLMDKLEKAMTVVVPSEVFISVEEKELWKEAKNTLRPFVREELWSKYKLVNKLTFETEDIVERCCVALGIVGEKRQAELRKSIVYEVSRNLAQHRQNIKRMVMTEWQGKHV